MSRSGYVEDDGSDQWQQIMWRGTVASSIRGKRGQAFLREMADALDAMPEKRLITGELRHNGEVCAIGCVGAKRGVELEKLDPDDYATIAGTFGIAAALVREIEYVNDGWDPLSPEARWQFVRRWVAEQIKP